MKFGTLSLFAVVVATAVLCYINILPNDFCFDDIPVVRDSAKIQGDHQWGAIWSTDYWSQNLQGSPNRDLLYRPVSLSVFRLTRLVAGPEPWPFHLMSIALNALCAVLVVQLVRALCGFNTAALLAGLVFAVLPIHTEVVASVVGQTDLLATAGTIGAILCHFKIARASRRLTAGGWALAASVCAFAAMGAKESGICVVPLVVLAELLGLTTFRASTLTPAPLPERERGLQMHASLGLRIVKTAYLLIPVAVYLVLRYQALEGALHQAPAPTKTVNVLVDAPAWQRGLGVLQAWGMYWAKTFYPRELCIEYAINTVRLATGLWQFHVLLGLVWAGVLAMVGVWGWRSGRKDLVFVVVALVVSYLPTSNALVLIQVFFAERIWYLPSVFVVALVGMAAYRLLDRRIWRVVGVSLIAVMVVRCWVRNSEWKNNGTLFAAAYFDHPQSVMARHLYGQWLTNHGEVERGIEIIHKALDIDLGFTDAHRSLGKAYLRLGRIGDALRHFQIAHMQAPGDPETERALAETSERLLSEAGPQLKQLELAAQENAGNVAAQLAYVHMLRSLGLTSEALKQLEMNQSHFANDSQWFAEWAITLVFLDRRDEAIEKYRRALELDAGNGQLMVELAMLLLERRAGTDVQEAGELVRGGLRIQPESARFHAALGEVLAVQGDIAAARESFRRAMALAGPGSEEARRLAERIRALGQ